VVEDVICVLNREQGGEAALKKAGIRLHSVLKVSQILGQLLRANLINDQQLAEIREALENPKKPADSGKDSITAWSLTNRADELRKNPLNARLLDIMLKKKSNLCVAIDLPDAAQFLEASIKLMLNYYSLF
jgi:uridine monophosphate synthetase